MNIWNWLFGKADSFDRRPNRKATSGSVPMAKEDAFDKLEKHGLRAYRYMPAIGIKDKGLAHACRVLGRAGCLIIDAEGRMVGNMYVARLTTEDVVAVRRPAFKVVEIVESKSSCIKGVK